MSKTCVEDLQLLRQTVLYFLEFQKYHSSAVKLEKVAETFTKIAEAYVRHVFRKQNTSAPTMFERDHARNSNIAIPVRDSGNPHSVRTSSPLSPSEPQREGVTSQMSKHMEPGQMDYQLRLDETVTLDPTALFQLFSYSGSSQEALCSHQSSFASATSSEGVVVMDSVSGESDDSLQKSQPTEPGQFVSLRDVEMNGRNQFSNCTFDWFALENYDM